MKTIPKRQSLLLIIMLLCTAVILGQDPAWKWAATAGRATITGSVADTLGNFMTIGQFEGGGLQIGSIMLPGSGAVSSKSMFVSKHNLAGRMVWASSAFGTNTGSLVEPVDIRVNELGETVGMCLVKNTTELKFGKYTFSLNPAYDILTVFKISRNGRILWIRVVGTKKGQTNGVVGNDMKLDRFGNVYLCGSFQADSLYFGRETLAGDTSRMLMFVAKLNSFGSLAWAKTCGHPETGSNSVITGRMLSLTWDGICITGEMSGSDEFSLGNDVLFSDETPSAYLAKLDYNGAFQWARSFTGLLVEFIDKMTVGLTGEVTVAGIYNSPELFASSSTLVNSSNGFDVFVAHFQPNGDLTWIKSIDTQLSLIQSPGRNIFMDTDPLGNVSLVTYYMGTTVLTQDDAMPNAAPGTRDILIMQVDRAGGNKTWAFTGNSGGDDLLNEVSSDRYGNLYLTGLLIDPIMIGTFGLIDNIGNGGFYIARINFRGEIKYVKPNLNSANGNMASQKISVDPYGNLYLVGDFNGVNNMLGSIDLINPGEGGVFFSKYSFLSNITGKVLQQNGQVVTSGMVKLFGHTRFQRAPLSDSALIQSDGTYLLKDIPYGKYILYAIPMVATQGKLVPAYYPGVSHWENSTPLVIASDLPLLGTDIHVLEKPASTGAASLGGMIYESDSSFLFKSTQDIMAKAVKKADVVLVGKTKASNNVIAFTTTDDNGNFAFDNIPDGSYTIIVDIPGMPHDSYYDVNVTGGQIVMNLDYLVGEEYITPENNVTSLPPDKLTEESILVYPNPFREDLVVHVSSAIAGNAEIRMFSITGQMLYQTDLSLTEGLNLIDLSKLPGGMYLLEIETDTRLFKQKILKE
jgi:hypothetical protein